MGTKMRWIALGLLSVLVASGCEDSAVEGLKGRWNGTINCAVDVADVTMSLQVFDETISGDAVTRLKEINTDWKVKGAQDVLDRTARCRDDTCTTSDDCVDRGGGQCNQFGICQPCEINENWRRVTLTLSENPQSPEVVMVLERFGDARLSGTIKGFCRDEKLAEPRVVVSKDE